MHAARRSRLPDSEAGRQEPAAARGGGGARLGNGLPLWMAFPTERHAPAVTR